MGIPVVLIHHGASDRYPLALIADHARRFGNAVTLIGDEANGADEMIADYASVADEFARMYVHLSTNHVEFERFCIARWFILREWMAVRGVMDCLYIDSDVLLFTNAGDEFARWGSGYDFTLALGTSPATSFFNYQGLYDFCDWVYKVYADKGEIFKEFERIFREMRAQDLPGGICDMTLFKFYREYIGAKRIGEMTRIIEGTTWDHNVNSSDGFAMKNGVKAIMYRPFNYDEPIGIHCPDNENVRFLSLHCQGGAKYLLSQLARGEQ